MTYTPARPTALALGLVLSTFIFPAWLGAQVASMTMPKELDHLAGNSPEGRVWEDPSFVLLVVFDADQFPWGRGNRFDIHGIRLRRNSLINFKYGDVVRKPTIKLSRDGGAPAVLNSTIGPSPFASWHGTDQASFALSDVAFPCQGEVAFATAAPFVADFKLPAGQTYRVAAAAQTLTIEFSVTQTATSTRWLVDHENSIPNYYAALDRGGLLKLGPRCPTTGVRGCENLRLPRAMDDVGMTGMYLGQNFRIWCIPDVATPTAGSRGWGWIGDGFRNPVQIAPGCEIWVNPKIVVPTVFGTQNQMEIRGLVPNVASLASQKFGCQFAALDPGWPHGLGLSAGYVVTIGTGQPVDAQYAALHANSQAAGFPSSGTVLGSVPVLEFY